MFTWIPIYTELAGKLLEYRNRQDELFALSDEMHQQGLQVIIFKDKNKEQEEVPLRELDLLTFFAHFNRGLKEENRVRILEFLRDRLSLKSPLPSDFHGVPVADLRKAWFFPYASSRNKGDVDALWDLAAACLKNGPDQIDPSCFQRCLEIKQVGVPKLTMGLFWINPHKYMALDSVMGKYLAKNGIQVKPAKFKTLKEYVDVINQTRTVLSSDYPQLSRDAYLYANEMSTSEEDLDRGFASLLEKLAKRNGESIERIVSTLATDSENDITNRITHLGHVRKVLQHTPLDLNGLQSALSKLWVFGTRSDASRQRAFFQSKKAEELIRNLIDPSIEDEVARIDRFISGAMAEGYTDRDGKDTSGAAQFASVLMSAAFPDQYVDYRGSRWNRLYQLVTGSDERLCKSNSHAVKINRAGKFAAALAQTPTFIKYFGEENSLWKVAGLAWCFREGLFDLASKSDGLTPKRYWAGGFLWGDESKLDDFISENYWQHGYSREHPKGGPTWNSFEQIKVGDEFAIKGYGGRNDLVVHYVGEVAAIDPDGGKLTLNPLKRSLYHGKAPPPGGKVNWFGTLLEVTSPQTVRAVFFGDANNEKELPMIPLNTILYGPPGTGKTYRTISDAVRIIDGTVPDTAKEIKARFDELVDQSRIAFATFHQSFSYEDFVEGIRPVLDDELDQAEMETPRYRCRDGIFKRMAIEALYASLEIKATSSHESDFKARWGMLVAQIAENPAAEYDGLTPKTKYMLSVSSRGNITAQNVVNIQASQYVCSRNNMRRLCLAHPEKTSISIGDINATLDAGSHAHLAAIVFRMLMALKVPKVQKTNLSLNTNYEERKRIVLDFIDNQWGAEHQFVNSGKAPRYVLIIDEINRGNISKLFGELITLLEDDKRLGADNALRVRLPYSGTWFGVPSNLYVVGTMNTADKSIALVDVALRRRFRFRELMPEYDLVDEPYRALLKEMNRRITLRKDRDHQIGHSYFMSVNDSESFNRVCADSVFPLLQEYFFNDWEGLRFVLADADSIFVRKLDDGDIREARNKWAWYWDVESENQVDVFDALSKNYHRISS